MIFNINLLACSSEPQAFFDQQTGLYWTHCPAEQVFTDQLCQGNAITMHWDEALRYCAELNNSKRQWRLANRDELLSYYVHFGALKMDMVNLYWTSSTQPDNPELAWYLIPKLNLLVANLKELDGLVLCVTSQ
ncbi:DUF1566 domain-containing protein [Methyloprofundus sp.]|uniref:Lcl C-terminal domain-containing protein n=1 Tax=Methyloprofundus sp. TaxID=2020875 RepID=UPI003D0E404C